MRIAEAAAGSAIATHVRIIDKIQVFDYNIIGASATLEKLSFQTTSRSFHQTLGSCDQPVQRPCLHLR